MGNNGNKKSALPVFAPSTQRINLDALLGGTEDKSALDADWNMVAPETLHAMVWSLSHLGGTVQFGTTKNNKAYTIKIYLGKAYDPIYFDGDDAGRAAMSTLAQALVETAAAQA